VKGQKVNLQAKYIAEQAISAHPESTLQSAISSAHNGLSELQCAIDAFASRLSGVLQPEVPTPLGAASDKVRDVDRPHSPAVDELHKMRARIESLTICINELSARCEA
jgi:hypothetical protein